MSAKTKIISYRTTPYARRRLGALAKRQLRAAGVRVSTKNRDQISLYMGQVTEALLAGKIKLPTRFLAETS